MNFNQPLDLITLVFLLVGNLIIILAAVQTGKVFLLIKETKKNKGWLILFFLVVLFSTAYLISTYLFIKGLRNYLLISFGSILLMGAVFVLITMQLILSTLSEVLSTSRKLIINESNLESQINTRSQELQRRILQMRTSADISKIISGVKDKQLLLEQLVSLIQERFVLYYAGVFLVDEFLQFAVLQAGSGEAGKKMVANKHRLVIEDTSMIGWSINNKKARIALDVGLDAVRFINPDLPNTRSELALPIIAGNQVLGALTIQSIDEAAFNLDDIVALQSIADTLAIALENIRLFNELKQKLHEIEATNSQYLINSWSSQVRTGNLEYSFENPIASSDDQLPSIQIPLSLRDIVIGQFTLDGIKDWTEDNKNLVESIAAQTALALENARLLEESKYIASRERMIADISNKVWASPYTDSILKTTVKELGQALRADEATIELMILKPKAETKGLGDE
jgi:GAF domain-containing protein